MYSDNLLNFFKDIDQSPRNFNKDILDMIEVNLQRGWYQRMKNKILMGPLLEKMAAWCFINPKAMKQENYVTKVKSDKTIVILEDHYPPNNRETSNSPQPRNASKLSCFKHKIWPKNNWLPTYDPKKSR